MNKDKMKKIAQAAALRATILAAAGTGMAASASAQEQAAGDDKNKIEMSASTSINDMEDAFADFAAEAEKAFSGFTDNNNRQIEEMKKAAAQKQEEIRGGITGDVRTAQDKNGTVKYAFTDKGLALEADLSVNTASLLPPMAKSKDGLYHCGTSKGTVQSAVLMAEKQHLQKMVINQIICRDLESRRQNGENLGERELDFMQRHREQMKKEGLGVNPKTGKMQRTDGNIYNPLKTMHGGR